jgi:F1F0 ATPase subunit 2
MTDAVTLVLSFAAGLGLGGLFFAGLWWTVRRCVTSNHPALLILGSLLVRTAAVLLGFYWVSGGSWPRLLACAIGFAAARLVVTGLALPPAGDDSEDSLHAPES